jgi:GNAT superfamily N-acetyltransferase
LVAETEGIVVGHVAFSPVTIDNNENFQGYILAPLGVKPDYQNRRIGSKLIESGMQQLSRMGVDILFVYGDPKYTASLVLVWMLLNVISHLISFNILLGGKASTSMNVVLESHLSK